MGSIVNSLEEYKSFIAQVREKTGVQSFVADAEGLVSFRVDDKYNVNLQFVEPTRRILCFVEVCSLGSETPKAVYRDLLAGALFGRDTAGGFFTLEPTSETLIYNYFFNGDDAAEDAEEFVRTLEKILQLCDMWIDRINTCIENSIRKKEFTPLEHMDMIP